MSLFASVDALAANVRDGDLLVIPRDHSGVPMEMVRALVRRGVTGLRVACLTGVGLSVDLLIGAGCVAEVESPGISLGEFGPAPRFTRAIKQGTIRIKDATCPAMHAQLQASEKGVPFMPLRGIIGSDLLRVRPDWKVIDNPFGENDPIVLLPALRPDAALFHAAAADRHGNVWVGKRMELKTAAHASAKSLVTVERIVEGNLLDDDRTAAGCIPALYIEQIAEAKGGTWPCFFWDGVRADPAHLRQYADMAKTDDGFARYLQEFVFQHRAAA